MKKIKSTNGNLYVISAPSGAGKTTLVNALIKREENLCLSVSHTTRAKRPSEKEGVDYYFVDVNTFNQMIDHHAFLEYAHVFNHYYGTSKMWVESALAKGQDVILEIDWQGAKQVRQLFPFCVDIFILPPSMDLLEERLLNRGQDTMEVVKQRLADARCDVLHGNEFTYVVINDDFSKAVEDLVAIVRAHRLRNQYKVEELFKNE